MWIEISFNDIEELGIQLHKHNSVELTEKDKNALENLLNDKYMKLTPIWKAAVEKMRIVSRKTSFEVMHEKGYRYMVDNLLPKLIYRVRGIKE
jgi:DNA topoisomerase VI subunit A